MTLWRGRFRLRNLSLAAVAGLVAWNVLTYLRPPAPGKPGELLAPSGQLPVGRTSQHWVDNSAKRQDEESRAKREVMAHLWYPATVRETDAPAEYIPGFATIQGAVGEENLREAAGRSYEALSTARTHVVADAPLSPGSTRYPVVLLTHGLRFNSLGYSMLAEDLASHGYVVIGIDHPATAFAVLFPKQRVSLFDEPMWTKQRSPEETRAFESKHVELCAQDLVFVLDQLKRLDSGELSSSFRGRLDLAQIGIFGHSFGGRVAARACQLDKRLKAGIICDGFGRSMSIEKRADGSTVEQPMMVQYARRVPLHGWARLQALLQTPGIDLEAELQAARKEFCESVKAGSYEVTLNMPGVIHESFSDMPLLESGLDEETRRNRARAIEITRSFTRAFFDRHLLGRSAPLLDDAPYNPEEASLTRYTFRGR